MVAFFLLNTLVYLISLSIYIFYIYNSFKIFNIKNNLEMLLSTIKLYFRTPDEPLDSEDGVCSDNQKPSVILLNIRLIRLQF